MIMRSRKTEQRNVKKNLTKYSIVITPLPGSKMPAVNNICKVMVFPEVAFPKLCLRTLWPASISFKKCHILLKETVLMGTTTLVY